jgi:CheY-like chemotaxis protein
MEKQSRWTVLVAEDDVNHVYCIRYALEQASVSSHLAVVDDGDEAVKYLKGDGKYANRAQYPYPDLLLLDLKMPRVPGLEVMAWMQQQPEHRNLPTIVLTVSQELRDVTRAYQLGAKSFLVKPVNMQDLQNLLREMEKVMRTRVANGIPGPGFIPPNANPAGPAAE